MACEGGFFCVFIFGFDSEFFVLVRNFGAQGVLGVLFQVFCVLNVLVQTKLCNYE